jgi:hypothetical protein
MVLLKITLKDMACTFIKFRRTSDPANVVHCVPTTRRYGSFTLARSLRSSTGKSMTARIAACRPIAGSARSKALFHRRSPVTSRPAGRIQPQRTIRSG